MVIHFPFGQFYVEGFVMPNRLDRNRNGGGAIIYWLVQKKRSVFFLISIFPRAEFWSIFHQIVAEWWENIPFKSDWNWNLLSGLSLIVNNMFYSSTSLTDTCCNSNVQFVDNSSYHVSWYAPDLPSYVVLQICHDLGLLSSILSLRYPQRK